jgi:hypothetical protein
MAAGAGAAPAAAGQGAGSERDGEPGDGLLGGAAGSGLAERLAGEQGGVDAGAVVGDEGGRLDAEVAVERGADLVGGPVAAEQARPELVDDHADAAGRDAEVAELLVAADEGVQPDRVGPGDGDDQVAALERQAGDGVAAQADLVVEQLLVLFQAEAGCPSTRDGASWKRSSPASRYYRSAKDAGGSIHPRC